MNLITIAYKSIRQRMLASSLTALSVALGVMLMVSVLVIHGIVERMFSQRSIAYDLIVGPKGSDLQLVLSTVYRISPPIENLPYLYLKELEQDPRVEEAVPIALGDVTQQGGFPIVGTTERYLELPYAPQTQYEPAKMFQLRGTGFRKSFDAIIGSRVAKVNNWDLGSQFTLVHGGQDSDHVHDEKFTVVGVLKATGTPNDKTVFVHLNGFYAIAGHDKPADEAIKQLQEFFPNDPKIQALKPEDILGDHGGEEEHGGHHHAHVLPDELKEITSIMLRMKGPTAAIMFSSELKSGLRAQAVNPIFPMNRLMNDVVGNVRKVLVLLIFLIIIVSFVGIFVSIYNSMADRRREIAIMRALGARRQTVFSIILLESILLSLGGALLGLLLGHGLVFALAPYVERQSGILMNPLAFEPTEMWLLPLMVVLASFFGFIPGMTAYKTDVAKTLSD